MKLTKILTIRANLRCLSGLHIGGGDTEMHIGGIDNAVVRNPLTGRPYRHLSARRFWGKRFLGSFAGRFCVFTGRNAWRRCWMATARAGLLQ